MSSTYRRKVLGELVRETDITPEEAKTLPDRVALRSAYYQLAREIFKSTRDDRITLNNALDNIETPASEIYRLTDSIGVRAYAASILFGIAKDLFASDASGEAAYKAELVEMIKYRRTGVYPSLETPQGYYEYFDAFLKLLPERSVASIPMRQAAQADVA